MQTAFIACCLPHPVVAVVRFVSLLYYSGCLRPIDARAVVPFVLVRIVESTAESVALALAAPLRSFARFSPCLRRPAPPTDFKLSWAVVAPGVLYELTCRSAINNLVSLLPLDLSSERLSVQLDRVEGVGARDGSWRRIFHSSLLLVLCAILAGLNHALFVFRGELRSALG